MKSQFKYRTFIYLFGAIASLLSCADDTPIVNESELITSMYMVMETPNGSDSVVFSFKDLDGDGGNPPVIFAPKLKSNTLYQTSLRLLNESVSPPIEITDEIVSEGTDHQFFYTPSGQANLQISYLDFDSLGYPIGTKTNILTGNAGSGLLKISLKHLPEKKASGVQNGNITNSGGETDIELTFDLVLE
ncbi:MAG: type 1 periplasmic binding fold superfamily protein [Saprospiraceae bacterium]|nr:type 1 periplasmic binding fold superfamily protein [Saprospiraceae bacterium]